MTTEISDQTDGASASRQDAAWARMEEVVRQASAPAPPQTQAPQPAERPGRRRRRRGLRTGVVALVLLVAVAAGTVLVARDGYRQARASTPAPMATATDIARLEAATSDALAAQAAERAELASLAGIPTPATVAPVTDGYAASLRLYQELLTATPAPVRAKAVAAAARQQVGADAARLQGVAALPPVLLGAFLEDTTARVTRLQGVLHTLEHVLASRPAG